MNSLKGYEIKVVIMELGITRLCRRTFNNFQEGSEMIRLGDETIRKLC